MKKDIRKEQKRISENMLLDAFTYEELQQIAGNPEDIETIAARISADYETWYLSPACNDRETRPEELPEDVIIDAIRELTAE